MIGMTAIGLTGPVLGALLGVLLRAQDPKPDFARELAQLREAYEKAYADWRRPFDDAKPEERAKVELDRDKEPTKEFVGRFKDLAARAKGTEAVLGATVWLLQNGRSADRPDVAALLEEFKGSPGLNELIDALEDVPRSARLERTLSKLAMDSPHPQVRVAALWARAGTDVWDGNLTPDQKAALDRLVAEHPTTIKAQQAVRVLGIHEHYSVGRTPPDFEGTDVDGKRIKLSDFRGKVVLIDFWGFW